MRTFGEQLRELRLQKGLTLRELCRRANISPSFLSDIELGRRHPSERTSKSISKALETSSASLKSHDPRPVIKEVKRRILSDPKMGVALGRLLESDISPEELIRFVDTKEVRVV